MSETGCDSSSWCLRILTRRSASRPGFYQAVATQKDVTQEAFAPIASFRVSTGKTSEREVKEVIDARRNPKVSRNPSSYG